LIKVLGKSPDFVKQQTCRNCSSVLEYTQADTNKDSTTDYTGCTDSYKYVICPCCGVRVIVK